MNWRPPEELERLLNQLSDDRISEAEEARLADILRPDPAARRYYRQWLKLDSSLTWDYASVAVSPEEGPQAVGKRQPLSARYRLAVAASILLVAGFGLFWLLRKPDRDPPIAWIEEVQGTVWWMNGNQESLAEPGSSLRVPAGMIVLEGETASAQLRFDDGSTIALTGGADVAFSARGQKRLILRRGAMNAQVQPQPPGRAMLVRTATAEIEVLGTTFAVSLGPNETELNVATGSVQLRRLMDGKTVKVSAQQSVVVSLNATALAPEATRTAPARWRRSFEQEMPPATEGRWLPPEGALSGRVLALPYVAGRRKGNVPTIHHGVIIHALPGEPRGFVSLDRNSAVRVRYRVKGEKFVLLCFLSCRTERGHAGNFLLSHREPHPPTDALGWREVRLPVSAAHAIEAERYPSLNGTQLKCLILNSIETDVGLEIGEVEIGPLPTEAAAGLRKDDSISSG